MTPTDDQEPPGSGQEEPADSSHERPPALSLRAAQERAGIGRTSLYREIRAGLLKTVRVPTSGRTTRQVIEVEEFERWLAQYHPYAVQRGKRKPKEED